MTFYVVPFYGVRDRSVSTLVHISGQSLSHGHQRVARNAATSHLSVGTPVSPSGVR